MNEHSKQEQDTPSPVGMQPVPFQHRLATRLTAILVLLIIVSMAVIGTRLVQVSRQAMEQSIINSNRQLSERLASQAQEFADNVINLMTLTTQIPGMWQQSQNLRSISINERFRLFRALYAINAEGQTVSNTSGVSEAKWTEKVWFQQAMLGNTYISSPFIQNAERMVTFALPIWAFGKPTAVLGADVSVENLQKIVEQTQIGQQGVVFIVTNDGDWIAHSNPAQLAEKEKGPDMQSLFAAHQRVNVYRDENNTEVMCVYSPIPNTDWNVVVQQPLSEAYAPTANMAQQSLILVALSALVAIIVGWMFTTMTIRPLRMLVTGAAAIGGGDMSVVIPVKSQNEFGRLASAFNQMVDNLRASRARLEGWSQELEQQVTERTRVAELRAQQIATGAEVARIAATILDPDQLIVQVVHLIQERFGFYYVGLFLTDATRQQAILQYGIGSGSAYEAGRVMKERGHRLEVGGHSMIGWACAHGKARIALDVGEEAVRFANPLTPDTRSEMALPLQVGDPTSGQMRVLGALSVQSTQPSAFDENDIAALQGMANQIAVALENARLFQQTQATLKEMESTNRLLIGQGWQSFLEQTATTQRAEIHAPGAPATGPLSQPLTIPLELRGQSLGNLTLRRESNQPWIDEEIDLVKAIALQAGLAADNARLIEQTQRTLQETEGLYQAAQAITGAATIEDIGHTLVQHYNQLVGADRTLLFLVDHEYKTITFSTGSGRLGDDLQTSYERLSAGISGQVFQSGQPVLSNRIDDGIEPPATQAQRQRTKANALIVAPISVGDEVVGTVTSINRSDQRAFTQRDVDLLMALIAQAATAIENQRLIEQAQRQAEREQIIRHVTTRIRAAGDIQAILETTATELARAMSVPRAIVRLKVGNEAGVGSRK